MKRQRLQIYDEQQKPRDLSRPPTKEMGRCTPADTYEKLGRRLGQGTYGVVYKAKDRRNGTIVALKRCVFNDAEGASYAVSSDFGFPITWLREIEALRICHSCPYIIQLLDITVSKSSSVFLVFEYCENDLAEIVDNHYHIHQKSPFTEPAVKRLILHLLQALSFLHQHHWIHRDVKLSNLLYSNRTGMLKLADFGLSRRYDHTSDSIKLTPKVASLWYRPPEVLLLSETNSSLCRPSFYTQSIDLWAAGCVFVELILGYHPLSGKTEIEQIQLIGKFIGVPEYEGAERNSAISSSAKLQGLLNSYVGGRKYRILNRMPSLSEACRQLLTSLLQWDPELRWTSDQALRSPYFQELPMPLLESQMPRFDKDKSDCTK
jgi:cyclin-dependent kinase 10